MKKLVKILCIVVAALLLVGFGIHWGLKTWGKRNPVGNVVDAAYRSLFQKQSNPSVDEFKKLMGGMALGVCHPYDDPYNMSLLKGANIGWIRIDLPGDPPYEVDADGNPVPGPDGGLVETRWYKGFKERCRFYRENGFYDDLVKLIADGREKGFIRPVVETLFGCSAYINETIRLTEAGETDTSGASIFG